MNIDIQSLAQDLIGTTVPKPISGTLSGHAAGEPFDKHVFGFIKKKYPKYTFRQYEYLNMLYSQNPTVVSAEDRWALVEPSSLAYLLNRGKTSTENWTQVKQFEEKQNDTADILVVKDNFFNIIDAKTFNTKKDGQAPNIISSYKLANMCAHMLEDNNYSSHDIIYIGIAWELIDENLKCTDVAIKKLFKENPTDFYINWAAAMQIQFHVSALKQSYTCDVQQWCNDYLHTFIGQAAERADKMTKKFVEPFQKFL